MLVICAADDFLLPHHLQVMSEFVEDNPEYGIYSCNGEYLFDDSQVREVVYSDPEWLQERSLSLEEVIGACFFGVGAVFRRHIYELAGGHRARVYADDYDFWLRAMSRGVKHLIYARGPLGASQVGLPAECEPP